MEISKARLLIFIFVPLIIAFGIGIGIGYLASTDSKNENKKNELLNFYESLIEEIDNSFTSKIVDEIDTNIMRKHLKSLTSGVHLAGTNIDLISAQYIYDNWKSQGLDYYDIIDYDVLLSIPDENIPNSIEIRDSSNKKLYEFNITETIYDNDYNYTGAPFPFLAYSPNGSYASEIIYYVNFCTNDDFTVMEQRNINFNESIVMCKYGGGVFRGDKVFNAEIRGAKAVLLYEDPQRGAPEFVKNEIYPNGEFMPEDATQRGTIYRSEGDPLTPLYPSTKNAYRRNQDSIEEFPKIIAQVIGYKHAKAIFLLLKGNPEVVDNSWKGAMNVTYTYGGKLKDNQILKLNVLNQRKPSKTYNVIGMIKGSTEPDKYVMIGNHRDSWVLGGVDAKSGTTVLLEISRVLSKLKQTKAWKPKRSIVFLSWGAEECGLLGSLEWIEEFTKKLSANGVSYFNIDSTIKGNFSLSAKSSPLLFDVIYNVTKRIKVVDSDETVFERWIKYESNEDKTLPKISTKLGSNSDYMGFQQRIGLPCMDISYYHNKSDKYKALGTAFALYHTSYDTFKLVDSYIDPGFKAFKTMTIVMTELVRVLSESLILPFNCRSYGDELTKMLKTFQKNYAGVLKSKDISIIGIENAINNYTLAANNFHNRLANIDRTRINLVNQYNEQMRHVEKAFIDIRGSLRRGYMHLLSAPDLENKSTVLDFPSLVAAIERAIKNQTSDNWDAVRMELSIVIYVINSATTILDEPNKFGAYDR